MPSAHHSPPLPFDLCRPIPHPARGCTRRIVKPKLVAPRAVGDARLKVGEGRSLRSLAGKLGPAGLLTEMGVAGIARLAITRLGEFSSWQHRPETQHQDEHRKLDASHDV